MRLNLRIFFYRCIYKSALCANTIPLNNLSVHTKFNLSRFSNKFPHRLNFKTRQIYSRKIWHDTIPIKINMLIVARSIRWQRNTKISSWILVLSRDITALGFCSFNYVLVLRASVCFRETFVLLFSKYVLGYDVLIIFQTTNVRNFLVL